MIAEVREPANHPLALMVRPRERALAMLLADEPPTPELEELLEIISHQERGGAEFVSWATNRRVNK